jgi:aminopeptidase YwaD
MEPASRSVLYTLSMVVVLPLLVIAQSNPQITGAELLKHVKYLASDALEGRRIGSGGANAASEYIANEMKSYGLKPIGDNETYFQNFDFVNAVKLQGTNSLSVKLSGKAVDLATDRDYRPLGFSQCSSFTGGVIFVGYGISDSAKGYDDYAGVNVAGKAVIVFRNSPPSDSAKDLRAGSSLRYKASKARELGAKALIVVTGPEDSDNDDLMQLRYDNSSGSASILAVNITRKTADEIFRTSGTSVALLQGEINRLRSPKSFSLPNVEISINVSLKEIPVNARNVVGMLEGNDPLLKDQIILIGAHYDHLGMGGEGSFVPDSIAVHHGADDNASGTSGLLELAQAFASTKAKLRRGIVFVAFTGEEVGLLGSGYYVNHPILPLENTVAMLNMDMIGRLRDRKLVVNGVGTSPQFEALAKKYNADSTFVLTLTKDGYGSSDQSAFYGKKIPVLFFFTDIHPDYHRPSDTYDRLNYVGMEQVVRYISALATELDESSEKPTYVATEVPRQQMTARGPQVYMGTIPDFGEQVAGLKLSGVREGSPAAKAGLAAGDIIVKFGKVDIRNLYDFNFALGEYKPGDQVDVIIKRGDNSKTVHVILEKRSR